MRTPLLPALLAALEIIGGYLMGKPAPGAADAREAALGLLILEL